jgi:hypothetical protein
MEDKVKKAIDELREIIKGHNNGFIESKIVILRGIEEVIEILKEE